jgi:hypothetical protein
MNASLQALASLNSGATAPATTYANMLWYDTAANILKMRSEADDAWINVAYVDQSANAWRVLDNTQVVSTSGTTIGYLAVHATSTWQSGVNTLDTLVSPAKVKAAIQALVPAGYSDAQARAAQAGHSAGGVGSYGFFFNSNYSTVNNVNTTKNPGHLEAGSFLRWSGADPALNSYGFFATAPSGTWRLMGFFDYRENSSNEQTASPRFSLYLRVS